MFIWFANDCCSFKKSWDAEVCEPWFWSRVCVHVKLWAFHTWTLNTWTSGHVNKWVWRWKDKLGAALLTMEENSYLTHGEKKVTAALLGARHHNRWPSGSWTPDWSLLDICLQCGNQLISKINKTYTFGHYFKSSRFQDFAGIFQQKHLRASQKLTELKGSPEGFSKKYMNGCNGHLYSVWHMTTWPGIYLYFFKRRCRKFANVSSPPKVNIICKSLKEI